MKRRNEMRIASHFALIVWNVIPLVLAALLSGCMGGTGADRNPHLVTPANFLFYLNCIEEAMDSDRDEHWQSYVPIAKEVSRQPGYFVFWDENRRSYVALSLDKLRGAAGGEVATGQTLDALARLYYSSS